MNPKRFNFRKKAFPALIIVPAMMQLAHAATIIPDSFGNVTVPAATNAASTVLANGGSSPTKVVTIQGGAVLTGDGVLQDGVQVTATGYTISNSGSLIVAGSGVTVDAASSSTASVINNAGGVIQGGDDGIHFDGNGGSVTNFGTITGTGGPLSDGIEGFDNLTVINSGTISGAAGIFAGAGLDVTNNFGNSITGGVEAGIDATDSALINNFGTISSTGANGIIVDSDAEIFNSSTTDGFGTVIAGGRIEGATDAIFAGDGLSLVNESLSVINGLNGVGINAGANAEIFNDPGAVISGTLGGISAGSAGYVENDGSILGGGGDGVTFYGTGGEVLNFGLIEGTTGIVAFNGSTITNSGTIRSTAIGGNAFSGGAGNDNLFLNLGSLVDGNVLGGGGINTITLDGGLTSPTSAGNTISGSVSGFSTITKQGTGVALIGSVSDVGSGLTVSADTIAITGGGLYINGDISGSTGPLATINANGAALGGTGVWNANVNILTGGISAGAIPINLDANPENAVGSVAITGDVVHSPGSFIRVDIVPDTVINDGINSDIIEQIGLGNTYSVAGANLRFSVTDVNRVVTAGTYTIVDSDEAIQGFGSLGTVGIQFNANTPDTGIFTATGSGANYLGSVFTNYFTTLSLADGGTNLVATVDYSFGELPGLSSNQSSLGGALDTLAARAGTGTLGLPEQQLIAALALSDLPSVQSSLAALSPEANLNVAVGIVNNNYRLHRVVQNHLAASRSGAPPQEAPAAATDSKGGMLPPPAASSVTSRSTVWGSVSYDWQDYEGSSSAQDFDGETGAITAGYDYRISSKLLIGGMIDGSTSDYDGNGGGTDIDSLRLAVYGTYGESLGLYSDFLLGYGDHDLDQSRSVGGIPGIGGIRSGSTEASSFQALATVGYAMGDERVKHGPFAGLEYQSLDVDGFTDVGGGVNVLVNDYDIDSLRGLIGYRVDANLGTFRPYASIAYAHEFEDGANSATASIGGVGFAVQGAELQSAVLLTVGTGISINSSLTVDVGYRGEIPVDDEGLTSHGASLGLSYSF